MTSILALWTAHFCVHTCLLSKYSLSSIWSDSCRTAVRISCTCYIWGVKWHWLDNFLLYAVIDQNIVFLVSDSCRTTVRNCNRTKPLLLTGHHHNTIRMTFDFAHFRQFGSCFEVFDIAGWVQYTYIFGKYKMPLYMLRNRTEKISKGSLCFYLFLKFIQINFIFSNNVRILSI